MMACKVVLSFEFMEALKMHFRVAVNLIMEARLSAKLLILKLFMFADE